MQKPFIFIGSSSEGLEVAKAVQANLDRVSECQIWHQGLFGLSSGTLETLVNSVREFDFSILVLTNDDLVSTRGQEYNSPRDNVLFELGLFMGALGRNRTFIVIDRSGQLKLPSDLAGITPASFDHPQRGTMQSAVGKACYDIEAISKLGNRQKDTNKSDSDFDYENSKQMILNYMNANSYEIVSCERLQSMNSKFTKEHVEKLIQQYPNIFRIAIAKGNKPGIGVIR